MLNLFVASSIIWASVGNMYNFFLLILVIQSSSFILKEDIFSDKDIIVLSFPCNTVLILLNISKMLTKYANLHNVSSSLNIESYSFVFWVPKKIGSSPLNSKNLSNAFPFESHLTSVWNSGASCVEPKSLHKTLKRRVASRLYFTKFIALITRLSTSLNGSGNVLIANTCRWIIQWVPITCRATFLAYDAKNDATPGYIHNITVADLWVILLRVYITVLIYA